ncbi:MAG: dihydroorotate oxidase catalytic subunit, partial [Candidatus Saccharibacteria bacterium]|nr:dihydroorotate oxidase catalytic subunit [Candidatus Saccharibacteria bacterium]
MSKHTLAGLSLSSSLVAAAGFQNGTDEGLIMEKFNQLLDSGMGVITLGSFTLPVNEGNEAKYGPPVYYYDSRQGKTYNSMGLANVGAEAALRMAPSMVAKGHAQDKIIIFSGSPLGSLEHGTSVEQAYLLARKFLDSPADLVEINLSCPNVVTEEGGRKPVMGYDVESVTELLEKVTNDLEVSRLGFKLPPYMSDEEQELVSEIARLLNKVRPGFITVANTIPGQV